MTDSDILFKIKRIMSGVFLIESPEYAKGKAPVPRKGTSRNDCYRALYQIQELLQMRKLDTWLALQAEAKDAEENE